MRIETLLMLPVRPRYSSLALVCLVAVALASCSSTPTATGPTESTRQPFGTSGMGGEVAIGSTVTTNSVMAVNPSLRELKLKDSTGFVTNYVAGPEVHNFERIKPGNQMRITLTRETTVKVMAQGTPLTPFRQESSFLPTPSGEQPGGTAVVVTKTTAKITAINAWLGQVTLQDSDGKSSTFRVREAINLADVNVGDIVAVELRETRTLAPAL
jgi:hypothetical protein